MVTRFFKNHSRNKCFYSHRMNNKTISSEKRGKILLNPKHLCKCKH